MTAPTVAIICYENYDHMTHYETFMTYADRVLLIVSDRALPRSLLIMYYY